MGQQLLEDFSKTALPPIQANKPPQMGWSPPTHGIDKLNVDGATFYLDGSSGVGIVVRDHQGRIIAAKCIRF